MFLLYATLLVLNGISYAIWSGDPNELPRALPRLLLALLIAWGVRSRQLWAWLLGLLFAGFLALVGIVALPASFSYLETAGRPLPALDALFFVATIVVLLAALLLLLLPSTRQAVWEKRHPSG